MKETKNKSRKRFGHVMVDRDVFDVAHKYTKKNGHTMNWFVTRAIAAALPKEEEKNLVNA